jgi:hypothetical protein
MGDSRDASRVLVGRREEKRPLGRPSVEGSIILKWILKWNWKAWMGLIWLKDRERWRALLNVVKTCGFLKAREISRLVEELLASQETLCSMEFCELIAF